MANEHDCELVPVLADAERQQLAKLGVAALPALVQRAGPEGWRAFLNFFGDSIENDNTRAAYLKAVREFLEECDESGLEELADIEPFIVGAYVQHLQKVKELSKPTVKLKLAALRRFFDHLVVNQVLPKSPADAVRGPKVQVGRGKTSVLDREQQGPPARPPSGCVVERDGRLDTLPAGCSAPRLVWPPRSTLAPDSPVKCPRCGKDDDKVVDSRASAEGTVIRRRRECLACALRFTTYERVEESPLRVVKKNGDRVAFDREKVRSGMLRACEKLPVPVSLVDDAVARVEARCQADYDREVPSAVIGSAVMEELRKLHHVAYVRFASVYREFKDVQQFMHELQSILALQSGSEGARDGLRSAEATPPLEAEARE